MSTVNPCPLFSLVRSDSLRTTEGLSAYTSTFDPIDNRRDEILLVDPNGEPCATPLQGHQDRDIHHEYIDGSHGVSPRVLGHEVKLHVDFIGNDLRRRLERWMYDRARVMFSPGYGSRTELAWRPTEMSSASRYDLTGKHQIVSAIDQSASWTWDCAMPGRPSLMRKWTSAYAKVIKTPAGAGQVFVPSQTNQFYSGTTPPGSYPVGSSAADSGWSSWGTWNADIVRAFEATGFGVSDCPGALAVTCGTRRTWNGTDERALGRTLPTGITGAGSVWVGVFLRGRTGSGGYLELYNTNGFQKVVDLSAADLSDWTLVWVGGYSANWPGVANNQTVKVDLTPAVGYSDTFDLKVGPSVALWIASSESAPSFPQWRMNALSTADYLAAVNMTIPKTGSLMCSWYTPDWWTWGPHPFISHLIKNSVNDRFRLHLYGSQSYTNPRAAFYWGPSTGETIAAEDAGLLRAGRASTIAITWSERYLSMYINGAHVTTRANGIDFTTAPMTWQLFGVPGSYGCWPLVPLTLRIENEIWTANRIADVHETLAGIGALECTVPARGRSYYITEIPSTPRPAAGTTHWLGTLGLRQAGYTAADADLTCKEV